MDIFANGHAVMAETESNLKCGSVPVEFSDERDASADRVDGEEVPHRRPDLAVVAVGPPQPVPHLDRCDLRS